MLINFFFNIICTFSPKFWHYPLENKNKTKKEMKDIENVELVFCEKKEKKRKKIYINITTMVF